MQVLIAVDLAQDMTTRNKVMIQTSDGMKSIGFVEWIEQEFCDFRAVKVKLSLCITDYQAVFGGGRAIEDRSVATATIVQARLENKK